MSEPRPRVPLWLLSRVAGRLCALPVEHVVETMRPLPTKRFATAIESVLGVAVIRGAVVPVVDARVLLRGAGGDDVSGEHARVTAPADDERDADDETFEAAPRFVVVRTAHERVVALRVSEVLGVRDLPENAMRPIPLLLGDTAREAWAAMGTFDRELMVVLESGRLLSEAAWRALAREAG